VTPLLKSCRSALLVSLLASPACAAGAEDFVSANIISTLYHEYAHALMDQTQSAGSGDPQTAVDILSVAMLTAFWQEDPAESITALTALSFDLAAQEAESPAYWQVRNLDIDRYYKQVCLFYGADPEARLSLAEEFEIEGKTATDCAAEYAYAVASWAAPLMPIGADKSNKSNQFNGDSSTDTATLIADEIRDLNASYSLPRSVTAKLASCGEENAFYDAASATITICTEFVEFLERQAIANDL
jgi:hypothetical protein